MASRVCQGFKMNTDIRLATDFWRHPKVKKLEKRLGLKGVRSLQILWCWCAERRPSGLLSGMDAEDIELAADWHGKAGAFFEQCLGVWIDETESGYALHEWDLHNPWQAAQGEKAEAKREAGRKAAQARWSKRNAVLCEPDANAMPTQCDSMPPIPIPKPEEIKKLNTPHPPEGGESRRSNSLPMLRARMAAYTQTPELLTALEDFRQMRERIRKPLTARALELTLRELDKLAPDNDCRKIAILEQSIQRSWQGVFELAEPDGQKQPPKTFAQIQAEEREKRRLAAAEYDRQHEQQKEAMA